jgi:hypothetical protein
MVEYVVIIAGMVLVAIAGLVWVGTSTSQSFSKVSVGLTGVTSPVPGLKPVGPGTAPSGCAPGETVFTGTVKGSVVVPSNVSACLCDVNISGTLQVNPGPDTPFDIDPGTAAGDPCAPSTITVLCFGTSCNPSAPAEVTEPTPDVPTVAPVGNGDCPACGGGSTSAGTTTSAGVTNGATLDQLNTTCAPMLPSADANERPSFISGPVGDLVVNGYVGPGVLASNLQVSGSIRVDDSTFCDSFGFYNTTVDHSVSVWGNQAANYMGLIFGSVGGDVDVQQNLTSNGPFVQVGSGVGSLDVANNSGGAGINGTSVAGPAYFVDNQALPGYDDQCMGLDVDNLHAQSITVAQDDGAPDCIGNDRVTVDVEDSSAIGDGSAAGPIDVSHVSAGNLDLYSDNAANISVLDNEVGGTDFQGYAEVDHNTASGAITEDGNACVGPSYGSSHIEASYDNSASLALSYNNACGEVDTYSDLTGGDITMRGDVGEFLDANSDVTGGNLTMADATVTGWGVSASDNTVSGNLNIDGVTVTGCDPIGLGSGQSAYVVLVSSNKVGAQSGPSGNLTVDNITNDTSAQMVVNLGFGYAPNYVFGNLSSNSDVAVLGQNVVTGSVSVPVTGAPTITSIVDGTTGDAWGAGGSTTTDDTAQIMGTNLYEITSVTLNDLSGGNCGGDGCGAFLFQNYSPPTEVDGSWTGPDYLPDGQYTFTVTTPFGSVTSAPITVTN